MIAYWYEPVAEKMAPNRNGPSQLVPLSEISAQLAYPDERGLIDTAGRLLADTA